MASEGPLYAGTGANFDDGGVFAWTNATNIQGDTTGTKADCAVTGQDFDLSQRLRASNFGFDIPATATILGVLVEQERNFTGDGTNFVDSSVRLLVAGTEAGSDKGGGGGTYSNTKNIKEFGGAADTWGLSLTPAQVNASGFGVSFKGSRAGVAFDLTAHCYRVRITVTYAEPVAPRAAAYYHMMGMR
jgi:hypothetical protein